MFGDHFPKGGVINSCGNSQFGLDLGARRRAAPFEAALLHQQSNAAKGNALGACANPANAGGAEDQVKKRVAVNNDWGGHLSKNGLVGEKLPAEGAARGPLTCSFQK